MTTKMKVSVKKARASALIRQMNDQGQEDELENGKIRVQNATSQYTEQITLEGKSKSWGQPAKAGTVLIREERQRPGSSRCQIKSLMPTSRHKKWEKRL